MLQSKLLNEKGKNALRIMNDAGLKIEGQVKFAVDEHLPFMGYTTFQRQEHHIVVAKRALSSGMIEGLLIHELSHVYRTETNHPSHNSILLKDVAKQITGRFKIRAKYQLKILQEIVNHVQDLYADDIAFQVFVKNQTAVSYLDRIGMFFLDWMRAEPAQSKNKKRKAWFDLATMLNNAFVTSNLERHHIEHFEKKHRRSIGFFFPELTTISQKTLRISEHT